MVVLSICFIHRINLAIKGKLDETSSQSFISSVSVSSLFLCFIALAYILRYSAKISEFIYMKTLSSWNAPQLSQFTTLFSTLGTLIKHVLFCFGFCFFQANYQNVNNIHSMF